MKIGNGEKLFGAIMILIGGLLLINSLLFINVDEKDKEVKCYDRHNNEIVGEICIKEKDYVEDEFYLLFFIGFILIVMGGYSHLVSDFPSYSLYDNNPKTNFFGLEVGGKRQ
jgi:hypothetical protein